MYVQVRVLIYLSSQTPIRNISIGLLCVRGVLLHKRTIHNIKAAFVTFRTQHAMSHFKEIQ